MCRNTLRLFVRLMAVWGTLAALGPASQSQTALAEGDAAGGLRIGWAMADITPEVPVALVGFVQSRISEGVLDPIMATALVLESATDDRPADMAVLVSLDLCLFSDALLERVRAMVGESVPEIDVEKIVLNATHTHVAPGTHTASPDMAELLKEHGIDVPLEWSQWGLDLGTTPTRDYVEFAAARIAGAIERAWKDRALGGVSYGLAHAVVGHNRLAAYDNGRSQMYGATDRPDFSHIEGYEDHSVNLLYTWDAEGKLTGVVINVAVPSQVSGGSRITADFWHDTRVELRQRLGEGLFVLPQCSAAGDQSPSILVGRQAEARMERLTGRNRRQQIAVRIADAATAILPYMEKHVDWDPVLAHRVEQVELSRRRLTEEEVARRRQDFERLLGEYRKLRHALDEQPELKQKPGWYGPATGVYWHMRRALRVVQRFELQETQPTVPFEVHVIRLGDVAIATNPFELHLDFGVQMKARSKAVQTFVVQLAGSGYAKYLPTARGVAGGAYGAIPESTIIGPEGGRELVDRTVELIESLWVKEKK